MCVAKLNENPGREPWSSDYWKSLWVPILVFNTRWIIFLTYSLYKLQYLFEKNRNNWKETGDGPFCLKNDPCLQYLFLNISAYFANYGQIQQPYFHQTGQLLMFLQIQELLEFIYHKNISTYLVGV